MILKRRFPNYADMGPEQWTEHQVNSIEDILELDWIQRWIWDESPLYYSDNNPFYNPTKFPYNLIGTVNSEVTGTSHIVIGLFTEDPSHLGIKKYTRKDI